MNRKYIFLRKSLSLVIAASLTAGCLSGCGAGKKSAEEKKEEIEQTASDHTETEESNLVLSDQAVVAEKSELVKVKAKPDGTPYEIIVDTTLTAGSGDQLLDCTTVTDIKNTDGDEEFLDLGNGNYVWENHGADITYEGTSGRELPVAVKVSYFLDGEEKSPEEMAGVSGKVTIRFDYENKVKSEEGTIVPFMVLSAVVLDQDVFSNITVTNGELVSMDGTQAAIGIAFPGWKDYLQFSENEITEDMDELADYVEITADAVDFSLDFTETMVSSGLFEDLEDNSFDDLEDLADAFTELSDASDEILDGIGSLADGTDQLSGYFGQYVSGVNAVVSGISSLQQGVDALNTNKDALSTGAQAISDGLNALNTALGEAGDGDFSAVTNAMDAINADLTAVSAILAAMESSLSAAESYISSVTEWETGVKGYISSADNALSAIDTSGLEEDTAASIQAEISSARSSLAEALACSAPEVPELSVSMDGLEAVVTDIQTQAAVLSAASTQLAGFSGTMSALQENVSKLAEGSNSLSSGITTFNTGIASLAEGVAQLSSGASALTTAGSSMTSGMSTLASGASQLKIGYQEFDEEGIQELSDMAEGDMTDLLDKIKALRDADLTYDNFAGKMDGQESSVTFMIETDSIE